MVTPSGQEHVSARPNAGCLGNWVIGTPVKAVRDKRIGWNSRAEQDTTVSRVVVPSPDIVRVGVGRKNDLADKCGVGRSVSDLSDTNLRDGKQHSVQLGTAFRRPHFFPVDLGRIEVIIARIAHEIP